PIWGDQDRLIQVMSNFISNAVKFSPKGGRVKVKISEIQGRYRVAVIDKGPGIPTEFRGRIFERFTQADSSDTRQKGGTGLGLSISKAIIEKHDGNIGFDSEPGQGSSFYFDIDELVFLPGTAPSTGLIGTISRRVRKEGELPKILHIEDESDLCEVLRTLVRGDFEYRCASTLSEARQLLSCQAYDLVILDPGLPDGNGLDLLPSLNSQGTDGVPSIVYSSDSWESEKISDASAIFLKSRTTNAQLIAAIRRLTAPAY
ncbi:MAG: response regulator, partial [Rhodospirillales bacterium]|nr:response regulator [Rhodospirillales bacterium]